MIVVSNTTPIISLATVHRVDLLELLFEKINVPRAVYDELKAKRTYGYDEIDADFFKVHEIEGRSYLGFLLNDLDIGEAEAVVLAKEMKADILIMDEQMGYDIARSQHIFTIRTLNILHLAKQRHIITEIKPLLDEMIEKGRWYSQRVRNNFLRKIGEL